METNKSTILLVFSPVFGTYANDEYTNMHRWHKYRIRTKIWRHICGFISFHDPTDRRAFCLKTHKGCFSYLTGG